MVEAEPVRITWRLEPLDDRIVVLLGAFDPPTAAHVEILLSAAQRHDRVPVWGMTTVLLDRPADGLFDITERVEIVTAIARRTGSGFAVFDAATYLDVDRALREDGFDALFVIGSDKLAQLRDPSFYVERERGVAATFEQVAFDVIDRPPGSLSATDVRRRWSAGEDVAGMVPPEVVPALRLKGQGYTSGR